jgi:hypothetical protein
MPRGRLKTSLREDLDAGTAFINGGAGLVLAATNVFGLIDVKILLAMTQITLGALSVGIVRDRMSDRAKTASHLVDLVRLLKQVSVAAREMNAACWPANSSSASWCRPTRSGMVRRAVAGCPRRSGRDRRARAGRR